MIRTTRRVRWISTLAMALVLALVPLPSGAAEPGTDDAVTAAARLEDAAAVLPGGGEALAVSATLLGLLGQTLAAIDDGPWVPAVDPYGLPINLIPTLPIANVTKARAYADGCHVRIKPRKAKGCEYGDTSSDFTVLLMGDSHGAMWLPAFEAIAARRAGRSIC
jgi:hypothetical protein